MRNGSTILGAIQTKSGQIGAGGFATRVSLPANDGTMLIGTDTFNAYALAPAATKWVRQIRPGDNTTGSLIDLVYIRSSTGSNVGTYDVAIAPSNSAVRYIVCMGYVWVTQDAGVTYTRSALSQQANCNPNGQYRTTGKPLAVDPQNPAVCYFGSPQGLFYTQNFGANWTTVSVATIPAPTAVRLMCVAFDPNSAVTSTFKQGIYIFVPGSGLYRSTNGGTSWAAVALPPRLTYDHMKIGANGNVYLSGLNGATGQLNVYTGAAWNTAPTKVCKTVAISPFTAGQIFSVADGGGLDCSTDYGATWALGGAGVTKAVPNATVIPWHGNATTEAAYFSNGDIVFDPLVNRLWVGQGIGVWKLDSPPTALVNNTSPVLNWFEMSNGIENMVARTIRCSPDGHIGYSGDDRGCIILPRQTAGIGFPTLNGTDMNSPLQESGGCDYAPEDTNFWAMTSYLGGRATGWTPDLGKTWNRVDTLASSNAGSLGGGQIAVLSKTTWLQMMLFVNAGTAAQNGLYLTTNQGASWTLLTIGDNSSVFATNAFYYCRRILMKDRFTPGRAYFYNVVGNDANGLICRGIWRIDVNLTTGAPTITRVNTGYISTYGGDFSHGKFSQVSANDWLWAPGDGGLGLWRSTDGMATWAQMAASTDDQAAGTQWAEVYGVGVGAPAWNSSYSTLMVAGYRMNTPAIRTGANNANYGFWKSEDNGATWKLYAQFPGYIFDFPNDVAGDASRYGRFAVAWQGTGVSIIDYVYNMAVT